MEIRMMAVAALALAAACGGPGAAPGDGPGPQGGEGALPPGMTGGGGPNVFALLGAREQLALTGAQVTALDSIGSAWSVRNDSLRRQLGDNRERREITVIRPILERMAVNNEEANRAIEALLNAEQRRIACTLPVAQAERRRVTRGERRAGERRPGGFDGRGGRMRPGRGGGDTVPGMRMRRGWPWCPAAAPADSAG